MNNRVSGGTKPLSKMLGEMAVIACVQCSALGMTRVDKRASIDADRAHNAKQGVGKVSVVRLPGDAESKVQEIRVIHRQARTLLAGYTSQWGTDRRLLPNQFIGDFAGEFDVLQRAHDEKVLDLASNAKKYIRQAIQNLGSYEVQPPDETEIAASFSLAFELTPVPDVAAYSATDKALEQQMKDRFEQDIQASFQKAQKDLLSRLAEPLEDMVERMKLYDEREARRAKKGKGKGNDKAGTFKATVVTNITDIAKIFKAFNIAGDPLLAQIADKLAAFEGVEHSDLTRSKEFRQAMTKQAADIREMLGPWLS